MAEIKEIKRVNKLSQKFESGREKYGITSESFDQYVRFTKDDKLRYNLTELQLQELAIKNDKITSSEFKYRCLCGTPNTKKMLEKGILIKRSDNQEIISGLNEKDENKTKILIIGTCCIKEFVDNFCEGCNKALNRRLKYNLCKECLKVKNDKKKKDEKDKLLQAKLSAQLEKDINESKFSFGKFKGERIKLVFEDPKNHGYLVWFGSIREEKDKSGLLNGIKYMKEYYILQLLNKRSKNT